MAYADRIKRVLPPVTLEESYSLCRQRALSALSDWRWSIVNLPRHNQRHLYPVLALAARTVSLCDIHIARTARLGLLDDLREDMRNNFMEEESTDQFPALLDTLRRYRIPQQYLHDIVLAADMCLRIDRFESFDQWLQFGCRLGGGTLLSAGPVLGLDDSRHEAAAMACGQAIWLTWLMGDIGREIQKLEFFLPRGELQKFSVNLERHNPLAPDPSLLHLIRNLAARIEDLFAEGGQVIHGLNRDGQRTLRSLISVFWNCLQEIKMDPAGILAAGQSSPTGKPRFRFRFRHLMGLEGGASVLPAPDSHH